jgi:hypothetical protein
LFARSTKSDDDDLTMEWLLLWTIPPLKGPATCAGRRLIDVVVVVVSIILLGNILDDRVYICPTDKEDAEDTKRQEDVVKRDDRTVPDMILPYVLAALCRWYESLRKVLFSSKIVSTFALRREND